MKAKKGTGPLDSRKLMEAMAQSSHYPAVGTADDPVPPPKSDEPAPPPGQDADYRTLFLSPVSPGGRKTLTVSERTHDRLLAVYTAIGGRRTSFRGFVDSILLHHLDSYREEINAIHRRKSKTLL